MGLQSCIHGTLSWGGERSALSFHLTHNFLVCNSSMILISARDSCGHGAAGMVFLAAMVGHHPLLGLSQSLSCQDQEFLHGENTKEERVGYFVSETNISKHSLKVEETSVFLIMSECQ